MIILRSFKLQTLLDKSFRNLISFMLILNKFKSYVSIYTNKSFCNVYSCRAITVSLLPRDRTILAKVDGRLPFSNVKEFLSYLTDFLSAFKSTQPYTSRSTIVQTVSDLILVCVVLRAVLNSKAYDYLHSNNLTVPLPVGIARMLEYACIPTRKLLGGEGTSSFTGSIECSINVLEFLEFLRKNFVKYSSSNLVGDALNLAKVENSRKDDNLDKLSETLAQEGFNITKPDLVRAINIAVKRFAGVSVHSNEYFKICFRILSALSSSSRNINETEYSPARPYSDKLGVYKFRNDGTFTDNRSYTVLSKAFLELGRPDQNILVYILFLLRPQFIIDGKVTNVCLPEDGVLDLSVYSLRQILESLFSFELVDRPGLNISADGSSGSNTPATGGNSNQTRAFSTLAEVGQINSLRHNLSKIDKRISFSHSCGFIRIRKPLFILISDYPSSG